MSKIYSKDMSSAYPAVMLQKKFPMSRFVNTDISSESELYEQCKKGEFAFLIACRIENISIKTMCTIPYIASAKLVKPTIGAKFDNGRVIGAKKLGLVITDIDYMIIKEQYDFKEEDFHIDAIYQAKYDYLPNEFRQYIFDRYIMKCDLKPVGSKEGDDDYLYNKEKNKINANFGMTLTDIVHDEIVFDPDYHDENGNLKPFRVIKAAVDVALGKHYRSRNTFLVYQWGIWVTAWCRYRLQQGIMGVAEDAIYCDTDSVKYFGDHEDLFERLNNQILEETAICGFDTEYTREDGIHFSLGLWEDDKNTPYKQFITLGSKKYAYIDSKDELHITVAGLSKKKGAEYLKEHGGLEAFKKDTEIPASSSGRTSATYDDVTTPFTVKLFDPQQKKYVEVVTGSSIAVENVSYTFGLTDEYETLLDNPDYIYHELLESFDKPIA